MAETNDTIEAILDAAPYSWTWEIVGPLIGDARWCVLVTGLPGDPIRVWASDPTIAVCEAFDKAALADPHAMPRPTLKQQEGGDE